MVVLSDGEIHGEDLAPVVERLHIGRHRRARRRHRHAAGRPGAGRRPTRRVQARPGGEVVISRLGPQIRSSARARRPAALYLARRSATADPRADRRSHLGDAEARPLELDPSTTLEERFQWPLARLACAVALARARRLRPSRAPHPRRRAMRPFALASPRCWRRRSAGAAGRHRPALAGSGQRRSTVQRAPPLVERLRLQPARADSRGLRRAGRTGRPAAAVPPLDSALRLQPGDPLAELQRRHGAPRRAAAGRRAQLLEQAAQRCAARSSPRTPSTTSATPGSTPRTRRGAIDAFKERSAPRTRPRRRASATSSSPCALLGNSSSRSSRSRQQEKQESSSGRTSRRSRIGSRTSHAAEARAEAEPTAGRAATDPSDRRRRRGRNRSRAAAAGRAATSARCRSSRTRRT